MRRNKDIDNFVRDAGRAARIAGSHVPGVKQALEGYEIADTAHRLSRSAPKAAKAAKQMIAKAVNQRRRKAVRNIKRQIGLR
jgi:hypothetical protein